MKVKYEQRKIYICQVIYELVYKQTNFVSTELDKRKSPCIAFQVN